MVGYFECIRYLSSGYEYFGKFVEREKMHWVTKVFFHKQYILTPARGY
jgi:hypothetical protein